MKTNPNQTASLIINTLLNKGVRQFFVAPGNRSSPLIEALARSKLAESLVYVDERSLGFLALGFAKASGETPALIVTSGTALGNLMPAVMESAHDNIPLLIISADRPFELQNVGANQTTHQDHFFAPFASRSISLPILNDTSPVSSIVTALDQLLPPGLSGVSHLNVCFQKPFFTTNENWELREIQTHKGAIQCEREPLNTLLETALRFDQGVILVGQNDSAVDIYSLLKLSNKLGWPIFIDLLSPMAIYHKHKEVIKNFDLILTLDNDLSSLNVEAILQIGDRFISAALNTFIQKSAPTLYAHIGSKEESVDVNHSITHRYISDTRQSVHMLSSLAQDIPLESNHHYIDAWQHLEEQTSVLTFQSCTTKGPLTLCSFFQSLSDHLHDNEELFISGSLSIRAASIAFKRPRFLSHLFANRGLSGIDGSLATSIGIAIGKQMPLVAIVGDQTFMHDMSSLQLLKQCPYPITIIVLDNGGGQIFADLPLPLSQASLNKFFINPSPIDYKKVASLFGLDYRTITQVSDMPLLQKERSHHTLIEVSIDAIACKKQRSFLKKAIEIPSRALSC